MGYYLPTVIYRMYREKGRDRIYNTRSKVTYTMLNQNAERDEMRMLMFKLYFCVVPPWGPGGLSRECVLRIPMRVVKGD